MATRFAIGNGNWSNTAIWDNGALPLSDDIIFANNFTVTIDQDITIGSLRNTASNVYLPAMPIPLMTGNTQPSGVAFASNNTGTAFQSFDNTGSTAWVSSGVGASFVGYNFPVGKIIKRYYLSKNGASTNPRSWTFEGSNDGITYDVLDTIVNNVSTTFYVSNVLANTTSYTYYRIVVTLVTSGSAVSISSLEMTESIDTVYGGTTGGNYTVPNTLVGSRNIVQTGAGIISTSSGSVVTTNHTAGSTVNFNIISGGLIFNQFNDPTGTSSSAKVVNVLGTGTINFNGDVYGTQTIGTNINGNAIGTIYINANATVTINGNVYLAKGSAGSAFYYMTINLVASASNSAILNINGNVIGSNITPRSYIALDSTATINITGNLISDVSPCIVTGGINGFSGGSGNINLVGTATMTNSTSQPCIITRDTLVTITGSITNKGDRTAIWGRKIRWGSTGTPYWIFQNTLSQDIVLTTGTATGSYPNESDVRLGVIYDSSPTRTGTCAVPLPQYVSQGVPVGSSVGTAYLNVEDIWNVLTSTITTVGSIGERLKIASTIQTTGDQLASYQG